VIAETIIFNLCRGSGLGVCSLKKVSSISPGLFNSNQDIFWKILQIIRVARFLFMV
jgi:hypothetical protein